MRSGAQTALNGNDSVCPQTKYGLARRKSNHADEEGDVRQMKSERRREEEKTVGEGGREERTLAASRDDLKA